MKVTRPTSILRVRPSQRTLAALRACAGMPSALLKSPPVPLGKIPNSTSLPEMRIPLATSEMVPSPPQAMISFAPLRAASAANETPAPGPSVKITVKAPKYVRKSEAIFGQFLRVAPPADSGLTMINGRDIGVKWCVWYQTLIPNQCNDHPSLFDRFHPAQQSYTSQYPLSLFAFANDRISLPAPIYQPAHRNGSESLLNDSNCAKPGGENYCITQQ